MKQAGIPSTSGGTLVRSFIHTPSLLLWLLLAAAAPAEQLVFLDFDTFTDDVSDDGKDHDYSLPERVDITALLNEKFAAYPVTFTSASPSTGLFSTLYFNVGLSDAGDIDFQNTDKFDSATIHIPKLLEIAGLAAPFSVPDVTIASVNIAAHETLHLLGTRHHDSYLPIGGGVPAPFVGSGYTPAFPGPATADLSAKEFNSLTGSIGFSAGKLLDPELFIGPRSAVKLLLDEFFDVDVDSADANEAMFPQPLELKTIPIPNPFAGDPVLGSFEIFADVAVVEEASIEMMDFAPVPESDYYAFFAEAGDLVHVEVLSDILDFRLSAFDATAVLLDPAAGFVPMDWFAAAEAAVSFDERESSDAFLWDVGIPATGPYVVEVTHDFGAGTSDGRMFGEYELLIYRLRAVVVPEASTLLLAILGVSLAACPGRLLIRDRLAIVAKPRARSSSEVKRMKTVCMDAIQSYQYTPRSGLT
jgi:hypothetical protein